MDINNWDETWGTIDWYKGSEEEIKQKIIDFYYAGVDFNMYATSSDPFSDDAGTPLCRAAVFSTVDIIDLLINGGADIALTDKYGNTPLHKAVNNDEMDNLKCLIRYAPKSVVNKQNGHDDTALQRAVDGKKVEMVKMLIDAGADVNIKNKDNETALYSLLHYDETKKRVEIAKELIKAGTDLNLKPHGNHTALHYASKNNKEEIAKALIDGGADLNVRDKEGNTPLNVITFQNSRIAKALIDAGADVNIGNNDGLTPLHRIMWSPEIIQALVDAGANVDVKDKHGDTPLYKAATRGCSETVQVLIDAGADISRALNSARGEITKRLLSIKAGEDVNKKDEKGWTVLHYAARDGSLIITNGMIKAGADVNILCETSDGPMTPLMLAAYNKHSEIIKALIKSGANINTQDERGRTALHLAVDKDCIEAVEALTDAGADVNIQDDRGNTPLLSIISDRYRFIVIYEEDLKKISCNEKMADILINHGADFDIKNNEGKTVRDYRKTSAATMIEIMETEAARASQKQAQSSLQGTLNKASATQNNMSLIKDTKTR